MVSGRLIVAVRQLLLVLFIFGAVGIYISHQQRAVYDQASEAVKRLQKLQSDNEKLREESKKVIVETNRTVELLSVHLKQLDMIESFTKKKNVIIKGLAESEDENLEQIIVNLFDEKLKISISSGDIESANRIETDQNINPRPVRIRFVRFKDKSKVFYKRKSLPKYLTLEEDTTQTQKANRKRLESYASKASQLGKAVKWNGGRLTVNGGEVNPVGS